MEGKSRSPAWRNPRDVMRRSVVRKSGSRRSLAVSLMKANAPLDSELHTESAPPPESLSSPAAKVNPFRRRSPRKRTLESNSTNVNSPQPDWDDSTANDSFSSPLMKRLDSVKRPAFDRLHSFDSNMSLNELYPVDFSGNLFSATASPTEAAPEVYTSPDLPTDMRLGTKMRIATKVPLPWMKNHEKCAGSVLVRVGSADRYEGMKLFMTATPNSPTGVSGSVEAVSPMCLFEAASLYWQFPSLPQLTFYPRIDTLTRGTGRGPHLPKDQQQLIVTQWSDCFDQLFLSWKKGDRHSFYVCSPLFTVLFTKVDDHSEPAPLEESMSCFATLDGKRHVAIVSNTNYYARQLFRNEGIIFEQVKEKRRKASEKFNEILFDDVTQSQPPPFDYCTSNPSTCNGDAEAEESETEDEHEEDNEENKENGEKEGDEEEFQEQAKSKWTRHESLDNFPKKNICDDRKTSTIVIKDSSSLQALSNVLQTERSVRTNSGALAGLPPTLLSHTPFVHAHLLSLKKSSQVVKRGADSVEFVCELHGPILPFHVHLMSRFLHSGNYVDKEKSAVLRVNERSVYNGLNTLGTKTDEWTEITVKKDRFEWSTAGSKTTS